MENDNRRSQPASTSVVKSLDYGTRFSMYLTGKYVNNNNSKVARRDVHSASVYNVLLRENEAKKRVASPGKDAPKKEKKVENENPYKPKVTLPAHMEPIYYLGGGNGVSLIEEILNGLGWRRTKDKSDDNFKFRWTELKSQINYNKFREGEQIVNHIPNCNLLTNKLGLLNSLQEYERVCTTTKKRVLKLDFIPETYRLDEVKDRELFLDTYQEGEVWICKPTGRNQGKGIFLVRNVDDVKNMIQEKEDKKEIGKPVKPLNRIIQRYIHNPLLIQGKKFDIRCYMLVANMVPYLVLYHSGYVRLSMYDYDYDSENLIAHLTNQFIQKKDPSYQERKEETAWTMAKFNDYVNENVAEDKGIEKDWVITTFENRVKQILTYCFKSVMHKFQRKIGYFDLYGIDFMIDENMKIWLIEINVNPCLATNCEALKEAVPPVVKESIYIAIESFEKSRKGRPLHPLQAMKGFQILYNENAKPRNQGGSPTRNYYGEKRSYSASPVRRSHYSPAKEPSQSFQERQAQKTRQTEPSGPFARNGTRATPTSVESTNGRHQRSENASNAAKPERRPPTRSGFASKKSDDAKEDTEKDKKDKRDVKDGSQARPVVLALSKARASTVANSKTPNTSDAEKSKLGERKTTVNGIKPANEVKKKNPVQATNDTNKSSEKLIDKTKVPDKENDIATKNEDVKDNSPNKGKDETKKTQTPRGKTPKNLTSTNMKNEKGNSNANNNTVQLPESNQTYLDTLEQKFTSEETSESSANHDNTKDSSSEQSDNSLLDKTVVLTKPVKPLTAKEREALKLDVYPRDMKRMPERQKSPYAANFLSSSSRPSSITLRMSHNHAAHQERRTKTPRPKSRNKEVENRGS